MKRLCLLVLIVFLAGCAGMNPTVENNLVTTAAPGGARLQVSPDFQHLASTAITPPGQNVRGKVYVHMFRRDTPFPQMLVITEAYAPGKLAHGNMSLHDLKPTIMEREVSVGKCRGREAFSYSRKGEAGWPFNENVGKVMSLENGKSGTSALLIMYLEDAKRADFDYDSFLSNGENMTADQKVYLYEMDRRAQDAVRIVD